MISGGLRDAAVSVEIERRRVQFERGNAMDLRGDIGTFDLVLMANLIDRLNEPRRCLDRLPALLNPGGQLIITSPYTWLAEYTPRTNHWAAEKSGKPVTTLDALKDALSEFSNFVSTGDAVSYSANTRKFQLCVAEASVWLRK